MISIHGNCSHVLKVESNLAPTKTIFLCRYWTGKKNVLWELSTCLAILVASLLNMKTSTNRKVVICITDWRINQGNISRSKSYELCFYLREEKTP